ncbi:GIY-YIG nuclease family protein [Variovorax paradoxus]|uniref:GIY-YIG nuclease family protein n=1 Tax=Variovorax paradoxus TaxID=34073 RepID=UPI0035C8DFA0
MAGKRGRSGGARLGAGRKSNAYHAALAAGEIKPKERRERAGLQTSCFVYVVHEVAQPDICKIGVARNPVRRCSHLQVGTWRELMLAHSFHLPGEAIAFAVEQEVHKALSDVRQRGEWFWAAPEIVVEHIHRALERVSAVQEVA